MYSRTLALSLKLTKLTFAYFIRNIIGPTLFVVNNRGLKHSVDNQFLVSLFTAV